MERVKKKIEGLHFQVEFIHKYVKTLYDSDKESFLIKTSKKTLQSRLDALLTYKRKYDELFEEISTEAEDELIKEVKERYETFEIICIEVERMIEKLMDAFECQNESDFDQNEKAQLVTVVKELMSVQMQSFSEMVSVQEKSFRDIVSAQTAKVDSHKLFPTKLPVLNLKTFSGGYAQWSEFFDIFKCSIDSRKDLAPVQKLQYLKACLKDEPAALIKNLSLKDENYAIALEQLRMRYANLKTIRDTHFDHLFNIYQLTKKTATGIRKLCNIMYENVQALENLKEPVDTWDSWLVYLLKKKLDPETRMEWERHSGTNEHPKFKEMLEFLLQFARALESSDDKPKRVNKLNQQQSLQVMYTAQSLECYMCKGNHALYNCNDFIKLSLSERKSFVMKTRLCFNCFSKQHLVLTCTKPPACNLCHRKHHLHLHEDYLAKPSVTSAHVARPYTSTKEVLLSTALVNVCTSTGKMMICRVLIDSGSQASFITESAVQRLRLTKKSICSPVQINGIGGISKGSISSHTVCTLHPLSSPTTEVEIKALVLDKITEQLPRRHIDEVHFPQLSNLDLADKCFDKPGGIDILLGADSYSHIIVPGGLIKNPDGNLVAMETIFGWVVTGSIDQSHKFPDMSENKETLVHFVGTSTDVLLKKFWEIEEIDKQKVWSLEEKECEKHFEETHSRQADGRYVVSLPFTERVDLGESRHNAVQRLRQIERKLSRDVQRKSEYSKVMDEYFELNHAEPVPQEEIQNTPVFYMPHHCVIKESSSTTKLRVVFDASCKTSSNVSLNDRLMVGPKIQEDLINILIRFRLHPVAFTADIAKMYRQIILCKEDRDFHRFVWRKDVTEEIKDYRMSRVTFGVASSAHHAQRVIKQLASDEGELYSLAAQVVNNDFYMDDCLSGASDTKTALHIQSELKGLFSSGGFELRKWSSNDPEFLAALPVSDCEIQGELNIDFDNNVISALGLYWHPASDTLSYKFQLDWFEYDSSPECTVTKRKLLSDTSRIFDPLGLLAPVLMVAKIMFQNLWLIGLNWDDNLPDEILSKWLVWKRDLSNLKNFRYDRCLIDKTRDISEYQIHGFSDASEVGYGAVVYMRSTSKSGDVSTKLIVSKTKVAPVKKISLPRLELCAAQLLARLLNKVHSSLSSLNLERLVVHAWSDSTVVLDWILGNPNRWKTFVANRVSEIQDLVDPSHWHHCPSEDNPSDCASRGTSTSALLKNDLWWHGPVWLALASEYWPTPHRPVNDQVLPESRQSHVVSCQHIVKGREEVLKLLFPFSSYIKIIRITAWCLRWLHRLRSSQKDSLRKEGLSCQELKYATCSWIRAAQQDTFSDEISCLKDKDDLPRKSPIKSLLPFLDDESILRVGGRLSSSSLSYAQRHPILLPKKHSFTDMLLDYEHKHNLHAGSQLMLAVIRRQYWIIGVRDLLRRMLHKCITCRRQRACTLEQLMGSLPSDRVTPARAFLKSGVDYAGPLLLRSGRGRGTRREKCWISLFICMVTKAIHLELVSALSTDAFLAALRRFVSRRGKPQVIYSDNGTNFIGANNQLKEVKRLLNSAQHNEKITRVLSEEGIDWRFSPPKGSHFGGLWEAGIKSVKYHLYRVAGNASLTFEEMSTLLCQIEACLNSRPLSPMSSDPNDLEALTPGHFLIGTSLQSVPEVDLTNSSINRLDRWQHVQRLNQHIWQRWSTEYLSQLQQRPKWVKLRRNLKVNDLVVIAEDNLLPSKWIMGRVVNTYPGTDGHVRVVQVKTANGICKRPVVKLSLLLPAED